MLGILIIEEEKHLIKYSNASAVFLLYYYFLCVSIQKFMKNMFYATHYQIIFKPPHYFMCN